MRGGGVQAAKRAKADAETRTASLSDKRSKVQKFLGQTPSLTSKQIKTGRGRLHRTKTASSIGTDQSSHPAAGLGDKGEAREKKLAAWLLPANTIKYAGCACACLCQSGAVLDTAC
jgi:hypothetical protein